RSIHLLAEVTVRFRPLFMRVRATCEVSESCSMIRDAPRVSFSGAEGYRFEPYRAYQAHTELRGGSSVSPAPRDAAPHPTSGRPAPAPRHLPVGPPRRGQ